MSSKPEIHFLTLFPFIIEVGLDLSIAKRARDKKLVNYQIHDWRAWGIGPHKQVDDTPYGGGAGMVLRVDVLDQALKEIEKKAGLLHKILLTPQGTVYDQPLAQKLATSGQNLLLICGHYEGFDERVRKLVDEEISIGNFVLSGGELPALLIADSIVRLIPGVLGNRESPQEESFSLKDPDTNQPLLEYPHYTRPDMHNKQTVPEVLKSGHHREIAKWRLSQARQRTRHKVDLAPTTDRI